MNITYKKKLLQGNIINQDNAIQKPTIVINRNNGNGNINKLYTLILYDPDVQFVHWVSINNSGTKLNDTKLNGTKINDELLKYIGPNPPNGIHNYQFLLYSQPSIIKNSKLDLDLDLNLNPKTPLQSIVQKLNLKLVSILSFKSGKLKLNKKLKTNKNNNKTLNKNG